MDPLIVKFYTVHEKIVHPSDPTSKNATVSPDRTSEYRCPRAKYMRPVCDVVVQSLCSVASGDGAPTNRSSATSGDRGAMQMSPTDVVVSVKGVEKSKFIAIVPGTGVLSEGPSIRRVAKKKNT